MMISPTKSGKGLKNDMSPSRSLRKKDLEIWLQQIPSHKDPSPSLEQYSTPATIAADILFTAYSFKDIYQKTVVDLGCGTGTFTLGSAYIGAQKSIGIDIDQGSISSARKVADDLKVSDRCEFIVSPVEAVDVIGDTVIMNPPFGSQNKGADIPFLEKAFKISHRIYTLHNAKSEDYIRSYITDHDHRIFGEKRYMFPVNKLFSFHRKDRKVFETVLFMIERN